MIRVSARLAVMIFHNGMARSLVVTRAYKVEEVRRVASVSWRNIVWDRSVPKVVRRIGTEVRAHCACYVKARALYEIDNVFEKFFDIFDFQCPPPATMPRPVLCLDIKIKLMEIDKK